MLNHPTSITCAFPRHLAAEVESLARTLNLPNAGQGIAVTLGSEPLVIPYRLYLPASCDAPLTPTQRLLHACLLTRHPDGHVRQQYLQRIITVQQPWVVPFVLQLCGEYVMELLEVCEAHLPALAPHLYGDFIRDNPAYFDTLRARMISYWDCYHRARHPQLREYVGYRLWRAFAGITARYCLQLGEPPQRMLRMQK